MTNLDHLIDKIIEDARQEAEQILAKAERKKEELIHEQTVKAEMEKSKMIEKARREAQQEKERIVSDARLKARDDILKAKQEMMDQVFSLAKAQLHQLNEVKFQEFMRNVLNSLPREGTEELIVPKGRLESVRKWFPDWKVSDTDFVDSGFMVKKGRILLNYTFDALVDYYREELEPVVAGILFGEQE
jgi:ATP synthase (E/31 kDa) subunit.